MTSFLTRSRDEAELAEAFDQAVDEVIAGRVLDPSTVRTSHPDLGDRADEVVELARLFADEPPSARPTIPGFEIQRELGRGGMGTVYLATQVGLGRMVAVKVLPPACAISDRARDRFRREARALACLRDPHIVCVHDVIEHGELLAYSMEWIEGPTLRSVIDELFAANGRPSLDDFTAAVGTDAAISGASSYVQHVVRMAEALARALHEVHEVGLVHRDVKPSNVMLRRDGTPVLTDFGLVRLSESDMTRTGAFIGTPVYAPPEQLRGEDGAADRRADVYALGVTVYEAVSGQVPFVGRTMHDILRRIDAGVAPPLRHRASHASKDLETVLAKSMARDPGDRYATAAEFADDLKALLDLRPVKARPEGRLKRTLRSLRRYRRVVCAGAAGAALTSAVVMLALVVSRDRAEARRAADALVLEARTGLLEDHAARRTRTWDGTGQLAALEAYDRALDLVADESVRRERELVAAVVARRSDDEDAPERSIIEFGPITVRALEQYELRADLRRVPREAIDAASPDDRATFGFLALLIGEDGACRRAWDELDAHDVDVPLRDAMLGVMRLRDGRADLAFPQLASACERYPNADFLDIEFAAAALELGRLDTTERHLASLSPTWSDTNAARAVRADLYWERGDTARARAEYEQLLESTPGHRLATLRLAKLEADVGEIDAARDRLTDAVRRRSDFIAARLALAEISRSTGDLPAYLDQARAAARTAMRRGRRSEAGLRDCRAILEIGGLDRLVARLDEETGLRTPRAGRGFLGVSRVIGTPIPHRERVEIVVARLAALDLDRMTPYRYGSPPLDVALRATRASVQLAVYFPELVPARSQLDRAIVRLAAMQLRSYWDPISLALVPALRRALPARPKSAMLPAARTLRPKPGRRFFGADVDNAGDVDGDGCDDVVVSTRVSDRVFSGATGVELWEFTTPSYNSLRASAGAGDLNGDGSADLIVGLPAFGDDTGRVLVYSGSTGQVLCTLDGERRGDEFGTDVAGVGDVDADGTPDIAVVALGPSGNGVVEVFSGLDQQRIHRFPGTPTDPLERVTPAGDVDGDGAADLLVVYWHHVELRSGRDGIEVLRMTVRQGCSCKQSVAVGDVDGDGATDFAVGVYGPEHGEVFVFSGHSGAEIRHFPGLWHNDGFGRSLGALGDADGNGHPDLAIGAPEWGAGPGHVRVVDLHDGRVLETLIGDAPKDTFAKKMAVGDVNGDGAPDLIVSGEQPGKEWSYQGYVRIFERNR